MFTFQHSAYLWLLPVVLLLIFLYVRYLKWRRTTVQRLGNPRLVPVLIKGKIAGRATTKLVLVTGAIIFGIIGLANLQMGKDTEKIERKGVDVMFALDVSKSMLAKDISPDRLTRAKLLIQTMINKMSDDRTGLILFAGRAYLQSPLTVDYASTKMLLSGAGPDVVPTQGTVLGDAIEMANQAFNNKDKKSKVIILLSDGEDHDEKAAKMAENAADNGIIIHTIGIGSVAGAPIFDPTLGSNKLDAQGHEIISKLNEAELQQIAAAGKGTYQLLTNNNETVSNLLSQIDKMEAKNMGSVLFANYKSYFQYFLLVAVVLLLIDWFIPAAKKSNMSVEHSFQTTGV
ncbi:hypothetical protein DBR32_02175 [Taibaiella sp. KBW10]|uniref:vWA domain-containing protein n=1 Tax=Taibaiella sp. KBW10 TaxID=2153357 RepID=UPI000F598C72|nr:VWA domain-containing protein [Taibaiella sp. KBW10]RQO32434.1 hypothetical protein DBR32_02175 [Taibaiella sp. KBW10]